MNYCFYFKENPFLLSSLLIRGLAFPPLINSTGLKSLTPAHSNYATHYIGVRW